MFLLLSRHLSALPLVGIKESPTSVEAQPAVKERQYLNIDSSDAP